LPRHPARELKNPHRCSEFRDHLNIEPSSCWLPAVQQKLVLVNPGQAPFQCVMIPLKAQIVLAEGLLGPASKRKAWAFRSNDEMKQEVVPAVFCSKAGMHIRFQ